MKKIFSIILFLILAQTLSAQTKFHMRYGSPYYDRAKKVIQTQDGNFVVVGQTNGFGSAGNAFIMKVNATGSILWIKDYSGINVDMIWDVIEQSDKKLMMCGSTSSYGAGGSDGFVMKTDSTGNLIWARAYGSIWWEYFLKISEDGANGFYVAGYAQDVSTTQGTAIIRMDVMGNISWAKWVDAWSAMGDWWPIDMTPIASGGVVLCGSNSTNSDIEVWKFSSSGNLIWSNQYSPGGYGYSILENNNGEILINHAFGNANTVAQSVDNCVMKLDSNGNLIWDKCYGGIYSDWSRTISNTSDGGVIICGFTNSAGNGDDDACLIKIDLNGLVQWAKAYGTAWTEDPSNAVQTSDGGFVFTGQTWAVGFDYDSSKVHLVKTDSLGSSSCNDVSWSPILTNQSTVISTPSTPINFSFQENQITWALNNRYFYTTDICNPASVESIEGEQNIISIYPNPFSTSATISINGQLKMGNGEFVMYDIFGREVKKLSIANYPFSIQRDNLPSGVYFYKVNAENKIIGTGKVIIE